MKTILSFLIIIMSASLYADESEKSSSAEERQLQNKLTNAELSAKQYKESAEKKILFLVKEKEELNKIISSNKKEIEKLTKEIEKLKLDLENSKPKSKHSSPEIKITFHNLKMKCWSEYKEFDLGQDIVQDVFKMFGNIKIPNISPDEGHRSYWDKNLKTLSVGFGSAGGKVVINVTEDNYKLLNDRFKNCSKYTTKGLEGSISTNKVITQNDFPEAMEIPCQYYESEKSEPVNHIMKLQHHYFSKVGFGQGMMLIMGLHHPDGGKTKVIVTIIEAIDIDALSTEISKHYDPDSLLKKEINWR